MHGDSPLAPPGVVVGTTEALLDRVIQRSSVGMAVIDHEGLFRLANPAYAAIFGCRPEELLGRSFLSLLLPPDRDRMLAQHRRFLDEGGEFKGELDVVRADGSPRRILGESVRLLADDARPLRLVYLLDITERRQSELAVQSQRRFLKSVLDGMGAEICVVDEQGVIVEVNRAWSDFSARHGGGGQAVGIGSNYLRVCERAAQSGEAGSAVAASFAERLRAVLAGRLSHFELEYPCHGPTERLWFVARVSRLEGSQPLRVVISHDDVSAIKGISETLRESEAQLRDLAACVPGVVFRLAWSADGTWRLVHLSPSARALLGVDPVQALQDVKSLWACIVPEDRPAHALSLQLAATQGVAWEHASRFRDVGTGSERWIQVHTGVPRSVQGGLVFTGVFTDITQRVHAEQGLRASEETYRTLFETVAQGVVYHDRTGRITSANPAAQRILGLTLAQMQGRDSVDPCWHATREDGSAFPGSEHPAMVALRTGLPVKDVVMGVAVPGAEPVWILVSAMPLTKQGVVQTVYASFEDISQRVRLSRELQRQALTDDLTGLANRRSVLESLGREFERVRRHVQVPCCLLAVDLDHFKGVNDQWGHATGDAVLAHVAALMQHTVRSADTVGRVGGEEFLVLLPDTGLEEARHLAERLRERLAHTPLQREGGCITVTASLGLSDLSVHDASAEEALGRADRALYEAKAAGRNCLRVWPRASHHKPPA